MSINILAVGDVVGASGLDYLRMKLRTIQKELNIGFTVVNGENASMTGLLPDQALDILYAGADAITLGNHTFGKGQICSFLDDNRYILRPANYAPQCPGRGYGIFESPVGDICVINLIGRCGMNFGPDNPFNSVSNIIKKVNTKIILIDFHAEATSEKGAMLYHLDGSVSAIWGTHTHVQTSDAMVSTGGTGFITDLGMTGSINSVIGITPQQSVSMFLGNPTSRFTDAGGKCKLECAVFTIDEASGKCTDCRSYRF